MTYLDQNKAIYAEMCKIAQDVFAELYEGSKVLRDAMEKKPTLTNTEFIKCDMRTPSLCEQAECQTDNDDLDEHVTIEVGNYKCSIKRRVVFDYLKPWMKLAKESDLCYCVNNDEGNVLAECEITFDNTVKAGAVKRLADYVHKDSVLRPQFCYVWVEYDPETHALTFVSSDTHRLMTITDDESDLHRSGKRYHTPITASDWKLMCDTMRKSKLPAKFTFYECKEGDYNHSLVVRVGGLTIKSHDTMLRFPNWRTALPDNSEMRHYTIHPDDRKEAQKWFSKVKKLSDGDYVSISVYDGSDRIYFDFCKSVSDHYDYNKHEQVYRLDRSSVSFRMTRYADRTEGIALEPDQVKKFQPVGFYIKEQYRAMYIEETCVSALMVMPLMADQVTFDVEHRAAAMAVAV